MSPLRLMLPMIVVLGIAAGPKFALRLRISDGDGHVRTLVRGLQLSRALSATGRTHSIDAGPLSPRWPRRIRPPGSASRVIGLPVRVPDLNPDYVRPPVTRSIGLLA
jgi:hypothetical protein